LISELTLLETDGQTKRKKKKATKRKRKWQVGLGRRSLTIINLL